jgi:hypothetical protein
MLELPAARTPTTSLFGSRASSGAKMVTGGLRIGRRIHESLRSRPSPSSNSPGLPRPELSPVTSVEESSFVGPA